MFPVYKMGEYFIEVGCLSKENGQQFLAHCGVILGCNFILVDKTQKITDDDLSPLALYVIQHCLMKIKGKIAKC